MMTQNAPATIDLKAALASLASYWPQSDKIDVFSAKLAQRPAQNTLIILGLSAVLFYTAEKNINPKVATIYDALEYCSSSLSVGYTGIYPMSPIGKLVATLLMTYGPALSGAMLDGPKIPAPALPAAPPQPDPTQQKILATLDQILLHLQHNDTSS